MPSSSWDEMSLGTWDRLTTWDDPASDILIDAAYARGELVVDSMLATTDWKGDRPNDSLSPSLARDEFLSTVGAGLGVTNVGGYQWNTGGGTASFAEGSSFGYFRPAALNTEYAALIDGIVEIDFDILIRVRATQLFTGARGVLTLYSRYQDTSNYLRSRLELNTDQTVNWRVERVVGGVTTGLGTGVLYNVYHDPAAWIWFRTQGARDQIRVKGWMHTNPIPREWQGLATDSVFAQTAGRSGWGGRLDTGNTNTLPYLEFQADTYWQGANAYLDSGQISVGLSLDDGLPSGATNTSNIGVNEAGADLLGPIGTSPDIYFSTFRTDQPFDDLPRDVGGVAITGRVLAPDGIRSVRLFTGRMTDIPINGQAANLTAISAARLALSAPIQPPAVHGFYQGGEATWLICYALYKSGIYVAPKPLDGCRLYLPLNGTTHPYIPDTNSGPAPFSGLTYVAIGTPRYERPNWIDGPFTAAPDLRIDSTAVKKVREGPGTAFTPIPIGPGADFLSASGFRGQFEAWVKGVPTDAANSLNPGQGDLFAIRMHNSISSRYAYLLVRSDRSIRLQISDGLLSRAYDIGSLPADDEWHFIGGSWDINPTAPTARVRLDNVTTTFTSTLLYVDLPVIEDAVIPRVESVIPCVEVRMTSGLIVSRNVWANSQTFDPGAIVRRSLLDMEAVAEPAPREAFELLSALAQSELAHTGFDAQDRYLYLPMSFWGEVDQQEVFETLSTDTNLGDSFKPIRDIKRTYNQVSLGYKKSTVQEQFVSGFSSSELIVIGPYQTVTAVAPLSSPAIEMRGLTLAVMDGTALAATPPASDNAINYVTLNSDIDGLGVYATPGQIDVTISSWTPGAATIQFRNRTGVVWFVANNVSQPPLGIAVKALTSADASESYSIASSIAERGVRNLPVSLPMIQTAYDAATIARCLAGFLAYPRTTLTSDAFPDFRRKPGVLVVVKDLDGTGLDGAFRLTGISTAQDGAAVQQAIAAEQAWPILTWGGNWGEAIWGEG